MSRNREGYVFSKNLREEKKKGCGSTYEQCDQKPHKKLQGHHLIPIFLAKQVIKSIANLQMLCESCHKKADKNHKEWNAKEIGIIAWSLFDLDPKEVTLAQGTISQTKRENKRKQKRRASRRKKKMRKNRNSRRERKRRVK